MPPAATIAAMVTGCINTRSSRFRIVGPSQLRRPIQFDFANSANVGFGLWLTQRNLYRLSFEFAAWTAKKPSVCS